VRFPHRTQSQINFTPPSPALGLGQDRCERGLADLKRIAPQVVAVQLDEVEGIEEYALDSSLVTDERSNEATSLPSQSTASHPAAFLWWRRAGCTHFRLATSCAFDNPSIACGVAGALLCGFSGGGSGPKWHYVMCGELTLDYRGLRIQSLTRRGAARALPHSICAIDR
jgi:hypothetical protein